MTLSYIVNRKYNFSVDFKDPTVFRQLFVRNIIILVHGIAFALTPFYLPQYIVHSIAGAGPLSVFMFDYLKFGKKINSKQAIGILLGLAGLILTINGQVFTSFFDSSY